MRSRVYEGGGPEEVLAFNEVMEVMARKPDREAGGEAFSHRGMRKRFLELFTVEDVWVKPRSGMGNGGKVYG